MDGDMGKRVAAVVLLVATVVAALLLAALWGEPPATSERPRDGRAPTEREEVAPERRRERVSHTASADDVTDRPETGDRASTPRGTLTERVLQEERERLAALPPHDVVFEVRDDAGHPVPAATIDVFAPRDARFYAEIETGERVQELAVDALGRATLRLGGPDAFAVMARADVSASPLRVVRHPGASRIAGTGPIVLTVSPSVTVEGTLSNEDGLPVAGAIIQVRARADRFGPVTDRSETTSDDDGRFMFEPWRRANADQISLSVTASGFERAFRLFNDIPRGTLDASLTLRRAGTLRLRCIDLEGTPIPSVGVTAVRGTGRTAFLGHTGADGQLSSSRLPNDATAVEIVPANHIATTLRFDRGAGLVDLGDVRLESGAEIRGRVVVPPEFEDVDITLALHDPDTGRATRTTSVLGGHFRIGPASALPHELTIDLGQPGDAGLRTRQFYAAGTGRGGDHDIRIHLPRPAHLEFRFSRTTDHDVEPVALRRGWIWVKRDDGSLALHCSMKLADAASTIRVLMLEPGTFDIRVKPWGHEYVTLEDVVIESGARIDLDVPMRPEELDESD